MPNLLNGWFADRAPGNGKQVYATPATPSSGFVPIGGPVGVGSPGVPPAPPFTALPAPGSVIPPPGSSSRPPYLLSLKKACAFTGYQALYNNFYSELSEFPTTFALSGWFNCAQDLDFGFTPTPSQGTILQTGGAHAGLAITPTSIQINSGGNYPSVATVPVVTTGPEYSVSANDFNNQGWVHLFASGQITDIDYSTGFTTVNLTLATFDSVLFNGDVTLDPWIIDSEPEGYAYFQFENDNITLSPLFATGNFIGGDQTNWGGSGNPASGGLINQLPADGLGLSAAVQELWITTKFVDWSVKANRDKFQISDGMLFNPTYAPCNLGATGALPFGYKPELYFGGLSAVFPINRATGLTSNVYGTLIDVDIPIA